MKLNPPIIANGYVTCHEDYFLIHWYYFPFGKKKVKYENIRSCELHETNDIGILEHKLWGMSISPIWWHWDVHRFSRKYYILIDASQWPLIGLTMDDRETIRVFNFLQQKMYENQKRSHAPLTLTDEKSNEILKKLFAHQPSDQIVEKN